MTDFQQSDKSERPDEELVLAGGKYRFFRRWGSPHVECDRYGEPWREFIGDKAVVALFEAALATPSSTQSPEFSDEDRRLAAVTIGLLERNWRNRERMTHHQGNLIVRALRAVVERSAIKSLWIPVTERLPEPVAGKGSYESYLTDVVLVRHRDRPDYPITAHAALGECTNFGVRVSTNGVSKHKWIAWYSVGRDLSNPFDMAATPDQKPFKDSAGYDKFMPNYFGHGITHWMPLPLSDEPESKVKSG